LEEDDVVEEVDDELADVGQSDAESAEREIGGEESIGPRRQTDEDQ